MSTNKKLVTVMFADDQAEGSVSLHEAGDGLRITIDALWESNGRIVVQSATVNQDMAGVLAEEIAHWLKSKQSPAPMAAGDDKA
jgi:hypothetical protein